MDFGGKGEKDMSQLSDEDLKMLQYAKHIQNYCKNQSRCTNCVFNTHALRKDPEYDGKYYICALECHIEKATPENWILDKIDTE